MSIDNEEDIWYNYGVNGIQGITVNNVDYVFRKNVFGDVTHIYKLNNRKLSLAAKYVYDAWGKCEVTEVDNSGIGNINPIRYRGYYYDTDTGLYYLNARYYDPETGRFISADSTQFLQPNTVNGLNLYAYCASNPVMNVDPSGRFALLTFLIGSLIAVVSTTAVGAVVGGVSAAIHGENIWKGIGNGAALGAMIGFSGVLIASGIATPLAGGFLASALVGAGVGSLFALGVNMHSQFGQGGGVGSLDIKQATASWGIGTAVGAVSGLMSKALGVMGSYYGQALGNTLSNSTFLGMGISKIFSRSILDIVFTALGCSIGGFLGGTIINYWATYGGIQDRNIPLWLATILKFFGGK